MNTERMTKIKHGLTLKDISYTLPTGDTLFERVGLSINQGDRIALVGRNGVGKSTLLRIMSGQIAPSTGGVDMSSVSYVDQLDEDIHMRPSETVMEYLVSKSEDWWNIEIQYQKLFGANSPDSTRRLKDLSGGEYMRLKLAIATYKNPDILLMDEPTNHLDITSKKMLQMFVNSFPGGIVLVSHDTHFINQVANDVWELAEKKLTKFGGNYQDYLVAKELEEDARQRRFTKAKNEIAKVRKTLQDEEKRAARSQRTGRQLAGDRSMSKVEKGFFKEKSQKSAGTKLVDISSKLSDLTEEVNANAPVVLKKARLNITNAESLNGKRLVEIHQGTVTIGEYQIIKDVDLLITYGDRVYISGENGSGKTTLIRSLLGVEGDKASISSPSKYLSPDLSCMYISQKYDQIDRSISVIDNMHKANPNADLQTIRKALGNQLFSDKGQIEKKTCDLSGGELARLAFAMASISPVDMLFLDEPTNNLDVDTVNIIASTLSDFEGTVVLISHDLAFVQKVGITHSYGITNKTLKKMKYLPSDREFYDELLAL